MLRLSVCDREVFCNIDTAALSFSEINALYLIYTYSSAIMKKMHDFVLF